MVVKYCLDTYALFELAIGNPKFAFLTKQEFVIPSTTLAEFYWVLRVKKKNAEYWIKQLAATSVMVNADTMVQAQAYRYANKNKDLSFFDAVGYQYARNHAQQFVTGDKEFKGLPGVKHISK
ncbi:hypothetical protein CMO91_05925 [Candidatus Woesearchaeota archaeon]|nr:hypothetical protein [Candidatus Woesearchaeota archaeon]